MFAVLLVPVVLLVLACLLDRHMIAERAVPRTPVVLTELVAPVVSLRAGPSLDGDTIPLSRAS